MTSGIAWLNSSTVLGLVYWSIVLLELGCVIWRSIKGWQQMLFQQYFMVMSAVYLDTRFNKKAYQFCTAEFYYTLPIAHTMRALLVIDVCIAYS